jgi:hypothetical protein
MEVRMRNPVSLAALLAISTALLATDTASGVKVTVRVEGATTTLFEKEIETDGHDVQAASDKVAHRCDGRNNEAHDEAGPTPTAALADASKIGAFTWDGRWGRSLEDYLITRIGPDQQAERWADGRWSLIVNGIYTETAGCQEQVKDGDEVLWAFGKGGAALQVTEVGSIRVGEPVRVRVTKLMRDPDSPEAAPVRLPVPGASLIDIDSLEAEDRLGRGGSTVGSPTDPQGYTEIVFDRPGVKRIKATAPNAFRSKLLSANVEA